MRKPKRRRRNRRRLHNALTLWENLDDPDAWHWFLHDEPYMRTERGWFRYLGMDYVTSRRML